MAGAISRHCAADPSAGGTESTAGEAPGSTITAFQSPDGTNFTQVGDPQDFGSLPSVTYAGLAVTSHRDGQYTIANFDVPSIKIEHR